MTVATVNGLFGACAAMPAVKLYVGMDAGSKNGERFDLTGPRMFNCTYGPLMKYLPGEVARVDGWCDSGAFQDPPDDRRTCEEVLAAQLAWETRASDKWGFPYRHNAVVSYDLLIDEKWTGRAKRKERWGVKDADAAVRATVEGAAYLASRRGCLHPRRLVLASQGVDCIQYAECAAGVLEHCKPGDIFGLGGWCILGREKKWLPVFWASVRKVLPMVAAAGLSRVHIFGVMWVRALGGLLWLCDRHRLVLSTDSKKPVSDCLWKTARQRKQAGARRDHWRDNVAWWRETLANLRSSPHYREPPLGRTYRQPDLFSEVA